MNRGTVRSENIFMFLFFFLLFYKYNREWDLVSCCAKFFRPQVFLIRLLRLFGSDGRNQIVLIWSENFSRMFRTWLANLTTITTLTGVKVSEYNIYSWSNQFIIIYRTDVNSCCTEILASTKYYPFQLRTQLKMQFQFSHNFARCTW